MFYIHEARRKMTEGPWGKTLEEEEADHVLAREREAVEVITYTTLALSMQ